MANLKITLERGLANKRKDQKEVMKSLGITKPHQSKIHPDNPQTRGKIRKVEHLVSVEEV